MYRRDIDGLRAIAVLSVLAYHLNHQWLPNGYLGVDIFFVISGYVITGSLAGKRFDSLHQFYVYFLARRVKRLLPALLVCVLASVVLMLFILPPSSNLATVTVRTGITALWGLSNVYLMKMQADYFGHDVESNVFAHTWSLGIEEQFYLLFPLLMWALWSYSGADNRQGSLWVGLVALGSLALYLLYGERASLEGFYLLPMRAWELLLGVVLYQVLCEKRFVGKSKNWFVEIGGILAVLGLGLILTMPVAFKTATTISAALITAVLIALAKRSIVLNRVLSMKPIVYVGLISYSLYLWHWVVIVISRTSTGMEWQLIPYQILLSFLLAIISYHFIESPLRYSSWKLLRLNLGKHWHTLLLGATASLAASVVMLGALSVLISGESPTQHSPMFGYRDRDMLAVTLDTGRGNEWKARDCTIVGNSDVGKSVDYQNCTLGEFSKLTRRVLVLGDSYALAQVKMFELLTEDNEWLVTIVTSLGAPPVPSLDFSNSWSGAGNYYWQEVVPELIGRLRRGDVVFLLTNAGPFVNQGGRSGSDNKFDKLDAGLGELATELENKQVSLVLTGALPQMLQVNCTPELARNDWWSFIGQPPCSYLKKAKMIEQVAAYNRLLTIQANESNHVHILDLFEVYCPDEVCEFYSNEGVLLYRDEFGHPSDEAAVNAQRMLVGFMEEVFGDQIPDH